ncbi:S-layer homology domain-containing protein [Lysinibacillus fusiformis]|nr:S-layer homology domain-containing protein [Lysinibacillus fusiformis]
MNKNTKKLFNVALASAMATGAVVAAAPSATEAATVTFKDLDAKNTHYNTIMNLVERGVVKGYEDKTFKPGQSLNRMHAALILATILDLDTKNVTDPKFKDVPKSHPYYGAIAALANKGYIKGFPDGTYGTTQTLTRGQMAKILTNAFELQAETTTTLPFKDVAKSEYKGNIAALFANGVTVGTTPTTYSPGAAVTRGQFATFVVRGEVAAPEKVVSVKDGELTTNKGTYAIEGDLTKVFNASNAAALKGAKVDFKFADQTAAVASLNAVAATVSTKKIVGLASLSLVAANATFDAAGYSIGELTVGGNNVEVKNVVAEKLSIAASATVKLTGVQAKEVVVAATTKLTLDATSKITKLTLPKGQDIKDVITNYDQVKDAITEVVAVDESGNETPVDPGTPPVGGGGGVTPSFDTTVDNVINSILTTYEADADFPSYVDLEFVPSTNTINLKVKDGEVALSKVRQDLDDANDNAPSFNEVINESNIVDLATVYSALTNVVVDGVTHTKAELIDDNFVPNKTAIINLVQEFVDAHQGTATNLGGLVDQTTTITVNFTGQASIPYTFTVID